MSRNFRLVEDTNGRLSEGILNYAAVLLDENDVPVTGLVIREAITEAVNESTLHSAN